MWLVCVLLIFCVGGLFGYLCFEVVVGLLMMLLLLVRVC